MGNLRDLSSYLETLGKGLDFSSCFLIYNLEINRSYLCIWTSWKLNESNCNMLCKYLGFQYIGGIVFINLPKLFRKYQL